MYIIPSIPDLPNAVTEAKPPITLSEIGEFAPLRTFSTSQNTSPANPGGNTHTPYCQAATFTKSPFPPFKMSFSFFLILFSASSHLRDLWLSAVTELEKQGR